MWWCSSLWIVLIIIAIHSSSTYPWTTCMSSAQGLTRLPRAPPTNGRPWPVRKDLAPPTNGMEKAWFWMPFPSHLWESTCQWFFSRPIEDCHLSTKKSVSVSFCPIPLQKSSQLSTMRQHNPQPPTTNHQPTSAGPPRPQDLVPLYELCSLLHQRFQESSLASSERKRIHLAYGTWGWFRIWFMMSNCLSKCFPKKDHPL